MSFKFVTGDNRGNFYAVEADGRLLHQSDQTRTGATRSAAPTWAAAKQIGSGWAGFMHVFSGGDGILYAVQPNGDLMYYKDLDNNGGWAHGGVGQKIGSGFDQFQHVFSGGDGIIYAVRHDGAVQFYKDLARDGTASWFNSGIGVVVATGWSNLRMIYSNGDGIIYVVTQSNDLLFLRDSTRDGTRPQSGPDPMAMTAATPKIGSGWGIASMGFGAGDGMIFMVRYDGDMYYYQDTARDGTENWGPFSGLLARSGGGAVGSTIEGYCEPSSAAPGETIAFKINSPAGCRVFYKELRFQANGSVGRGVSAVTLAPSPQTTNTDPVRNGCGWTTTTTLTIPADWPSGIYTAHCVDIYGSECYVSFVVKPAPAARGDIAVLANTNTWNCYNSWGGVGKYVGLGTARLSFARPNNAAPPFGEPSSHLLQGELWPLNWMMQEGYKVDVYCDKDFHVGIADFSAYKALVLTTHPEYWTIQMMDHLETYLAGGGCLLYLAGNGLFEECSFDPQTGALIALGGQDGADGGTRWSQFFRNPNTTPGLTRPARPERNILGVAYHNDSWQTYAPFKVLAAGAAHPFFAGTGLVADDLVGDQGLNGPGASGWEMDTSIAGTASDPDYVAELLVVDNNSPDMDRGTPPENLQLLARGTNSRDGRPYCYGADMTYYETGHTGANNRTGFVFTAASLTFCGSLVVDPKLQTIVRNALNACLGAHSRA